ncbi:MULTISPECIES: tryptophan biosynthesis modulator TrpM [unclassified Streptomyces]|uniref:tryptophan biosynthesis modulator TrpM n=1 Tax=unclassified Streptomyces TaxID=2593676 RepID=UPI0011C6FE13|nr:MULTISPECIES: tryptophan synthase subunit(beta) [unclassified Streptomyces]TXS08436.1 tryptophan synthase subunit(beta) [Streptomyces sp. wa22]
MSAARIPQGLPRPVGASARDPYAPSARGCHAPVSLRHPQPRRCAPPVWHRGCRAPARRVHGRRVRYVIGDEPGQVNGMRWRTGSAP